MNPTQVFQLVNENGQSMGTLNVILGNEIGRGQFGTVYRAHITNLDGTAGGKVAVKRVMWPAMQTETEARWSQLSQLLDLSHVNVVRTLHVGRQNDESSPVWIFQELCEGDLENALALRSNPIPEATKRNYTAQLLNGLQYLHSQPKRVIHCDMKTKNILLACSGTVVKLGDLDDSVRLRGSKTTTTDNVADMRGTYQYMSPEMLAVDSIVGSGTDIWSLGCIVLDMMVVDSNCRWTIGGTVASMATLEHITYIYLGGSENTAHPEIPGHLSSECQEFIRACFRRNVRRNAKTYGQNVKNSFEHVSAETEEGTGRPTASQLLQHTFVKDFRNAGQ